MQYWWRSIGEWLFNDDFELRAGSGPQWFGEGFVLEQRLVLGALAPLAAAPSVSANGNEQAETASHEESVTSTSTAAYTSGLALLPSHELEEVKSPNVLAEADEPIAFDSVTSISAVDVEDIALGPCAVGTCLFLADVGDNAEKRATVQIVIVPEKTRYKKSEKPLRIVTAKYPDKAHNVEGVAIHPTSGDLYLITKSFDQTNRRALVAKVFKLTARQMAKPGAVETFSEVGEIDLPYLLYDYGLPGQIVTGLDISDDGQRAIAITYQNAIEMALDFAAPMKASRTWKPNVDYRVIETAKLPQTEAVAYTTTGHGFIYDSETVKDGAESPLYRQTCAGAP